MFKVHLKNYLCIRQNLTCNAIKLYFLVSFFVQNQLTINIEKKTYRKHKEINDFFTTYS